MGEIKSSRAWLASLVHLVLDRWSRPRLTLAYCAIFLMVIFIFFIAENKKTDFSVSVWNNSDQPIRIISLDVDRELNFDIQPIYYQPHSPGFNYPNFARFKKSNDQELLLNFHIENGGIVTEKQCTLDARETSGPVLINVNYTGSRLTCFPDWFSYRKTV